MSRRTQLVVLAGAVGLWGCCTTDPAGPSDAEAPEPSASSADVRPPRCKLIGREEVLGRIADGEGNLDKILPFAAEVGRGVSFRGGFAVGALRQDGDGTGSVVVIANENGTAWRVLSLGASHGDAESPRVFSRGGMLGAALLEPSGATRTLRLARIEGEQVQWGAEMLQGLDESLAYDVVVGEKAGIAVWDDVPKEREVGAIYLAVFDAEGLKNPRAATTVTLPGTDAEMPRIVERPGGFWLFWVARRPGTGEHDARYRAEDIANRWLEVVPLDASGELSGSPVKLGSNEGHVLAYDVASLPDGSAVVMWRDDDTPSGSAGGELMRARVRLGGVDGPDRIEDEYLGIGSPNVMTGWLAVADALESTRLSPMNPDGTLADKLHGEALFGAGEPIANEGDKLFVSRPDGTAVRLFIAECERKVIESPATDAGP